MHLNEDEVTVDSNEVQSLFICVKTTPNIPQQNEVNAFWQVHKLSRLCQKIRQRKVGGAGKALLKFTRVTERITCPATSLNCQLYVKWERVLLPI